MKHFLIFLTIALLLIFFWPYEKKIEGFGKCYYSSIGIPICNYTHNFWGRYESINPFYENRLLELPLAAAYRYDGPAGWEGPSSKWLYADAANTGGPWPALGRVRYTPDYYDEVPFYYN